jgi:hypothetical protein
MIDVFSAWHGVHRSTPLAKADDLIDDPPLTGQGQGA